MQRRHHYERAFEEYLRVRRVPYVAVDEARKALLPTAHPAGAAPALKSFDFVVYGEGGNLLIDIKGRQVSFSRGRADTGSELRAGRLESWVTEDDVASLQHWEQLFGPGFEAVFLFVYCCQAQPPDALFQEIFEHRGQWYALRSVPVIEYVRAMKPRSPRWRTVDVPSRLFERISRPFVPPTPATPSTPWSHEFGPAEPVLQPLRG